MTRENIAFTESPHPGTKVHVAADGVYVGCIVISDELKPDSRGAVLALKAKGVRKTVMLTGDDPNIAGAVASELGLDEVYGGLLPHEKVEKLEALNREKTAGGKLAFVGDGINDAPVLAMADIGVAMGGLGSDAAIEAADIVLMTDEPTKLPLLVDIARFTKRIVWQNIIFALGIKTGFLALGAFGLASMWEAVFADVGVCLLAVLNAVRISHRRFGNG
jgi:Cd2+/Zn2+-exporting ATPase